MAWWRGAEAVATDSLTSNLPIEPDDYDYEQDYAYDRNGGDDLF